MNAGGKLFIYLDFIINQDYIAENLCENQDKPELKCNGKCFLAKELAKEEKKEKKESKVKFEDTNVYFFCSFEEIYESNPLYFEKREHANARVQAGSVGYLTKVFHPPALS
ncbi:MAG: hypothetical protein A3D92_03165 [Bacteroidetes bacterium RIFCSPHIGHO2_02_FULL_44_7]|nr:MAG: hypothetical protein A3D92_03165 [Bacteroidetes bacterium RIFCSPHIGHO2_02_FULL_44_7]